ncbi:DUF4192 family protein [Streptomyces sp. NPDC086787]|uniref:DUF4192 domain-containing protein n=1 Tax=Streptomyces sp. NPDC086787 TaxID=3365759 RepID=UPI0037F3EBF6
MTNHSETTGSFENGDIAGQGTHKLPPGDPGREAVTELGTGFGLAAPESQVTLRTPAELADALPYLLGYRPEDSIVLVALHDRGGRGRFGGRARLGIPASTDDWEAAARQLTRGLVAGSERRGTRPEQMVAYVCQEPARGESGRDVMRRLRPLAQLLRTECGLLDVPVIEALCISGGRFWSYCCPTEGCCPDDGAPMGLPGTSVLAAAATFAGIQVRGTLRELRARLLPWETSAALEQEIALDAAGMPLVSRILDDATREGVATETLDLAQRVIDRFGAAPPVSGTLPADLRDDELLTHEEAATLILGLQDRTTRDRAAAWMEGDEAGPALRLWRALSRRCVGPYGEHAAATLTLAGWVAWSIGDDLEAREALAMALGADPDYLFARLLHQACNEGLDPEAIRRCLRTERADTPERTQGAKPEVAAETRVECEEGAEEPDTKSEELDTKAEAALAENEEGAAGRLGTAPRCDGPGAGSPRRRRVGTVGGTDSTRPARVRIRRSRSDGTRARTAVPVPDRTRPGAARPAVTRKRASSEGDRRLGDTAPGGVRSAADDTETDA